MMIFKNVNMREMLLKHGSVNSLIKQFGGRYSQYNTQIIKELTSFDDPLIKHLPESLRKFKLSKYNLTKISELAENDELGIRKRSIQMSDILDLPKYSFITSGCFLKKLCELNGITFKSKKERVIHRYTKWSPKDLLLLEKLAGEGKTVREICKIMNRREESVRARANSIGIRFSKYVTLGQRIQSLDDQSKEVQLFRKLIEILNTSNKNIKLIFREDVHRVFLSSNIDLLNVEIVSEVISIIKSLEQQGLTHTNIFRVVDKHRAMY